MTENFRALYVELIEAVLSDDSHIDCVQIARRARAALAEQPVGPTLYLDFSRPRRIGDLKFSKETPAPHVPPTYISTAATDYLTERAQEFLDKFQEVYLASDDDKYVIATVLRMIAHSPDLVDLTESDLLDLANAISQL
jgi:hypothetical protein